MGFGVSPVIGVAKAGPGVSHRIVATDNVAVEPFFVSGGSVGGEV